MMVVGIWSGSCSKSKRIEDERAAAGASPAVATIGETKLTHVMFDDAITKALSQTASMGNSLDTPPAESDAMTAAEAVFQETQIRLLNVLASEQGITISDDAIKTAVTSEFDMRVSQFRQSLVGSKKLAATATDAQFAEVFAKETGKPLADMKAEFIESTMGSPTEKAQRAVSLSVEELQKKLVAKLTFTDEDLKRANDMFNVQRIFVPGDKEVVLKKAAADLAAGKDFDAVRKEVNAQVPQQERPEPPMSYATLIAKKELASLKTLAAGKTTPIIEIDGGRAIYKLVSVKSNPPKDFAKEKPQLQSSVAAQVGTQQLLAQVDSRANTDLKWTDRSFQYLYQVRKIMMSGDFTAADRETLTTIATDSANPEPGSQRYMAFAQLLASNQLWSKYTAAEKQQNRDARIEQLMRVLAELEDVSIRIDVATLLGEKGDVGMGDQLVRAASANAGSIGIAGGEYSQKLQAQFAIAKTKKLATPDEVKQIEASLSQFVANRAAYAAEQKRQAEEQKKIDEENKKAEEENRKAEEARKKAAGATAQPKTPTEGVNSSDLTKPSGGVSSSDLTKPQTPPSKP